MISQKAKYALRALIALARRRNDATLGIAQIAGQERIPKKFLEQILLEMKLAGILESRRGKAGGYLLARRPDQVTFGEVLRLIDGPVAPLACLSKVAYKPCKDCLNEAECEVRHVFARVAAATREVLDHTTLADALMDSNSPVPEIADL